MQQIFGSVQVWDKRLLRKKGEHLLKKIIEEPGRNLTQSRIRHDSGTRGEYDDISIL
jgi:hypothetical protein